MILWFKRKVEKKKPKGIIFPNTASENHYMVMKYIHSSQMWTDLTQKTFILRSPIPLN